MKLILSHPNGECEYSDNVWSICTFGIGESMLRTYRYELEGVGEPHLVAHFTDKKIKWNFCYSASVRYGFFSRYLGFSKKARSSTAKRADENICFKLLCTEEMDEVENTGIQHTDWMTFEEYYADLPF